MIWRHKGGMTRMKPMLGGKSESSNPMERSLILIESEYAISLRLTIWLSIVAN